MLNKFKLLALAAAFAGMASVASVAAAVTVTPFATPLTAGDAAFGNAVAVPFEDFGMTALSFAADGPLRAMISATINPFLISPGGMPSNSIDLAFAVNGGVASPLPVTQVPTPPSGSVGAAGVALDLLDGDVVSFFITGVAGMSGNQVTFAIETLPVPVPAVLPLMASALLGLGLMSRRRKSKNA